MAHDLNDLLRRLVALSPLSEDEAGSVFQAMLSGQMPEAQIAAVLSLIAARGPTADELVGAARVMRAFATPVPVPGGAVVLDTCGTGGTAKTFNVSTAAAIVIAAASPHHDGEPLRVVVAKHGNRSRSGRGSAEVLAALGVDVDAPPDRQARCLEQAGVCFCFAIHHHPAARHAAGVRKALGFPTIFNLLGPLTNPAGATHQLMGVFDPDRLEVMARVLGRLGAWRAMVVHSDDGLDELTITAPTRVAHLENGAVRTERLDPEPLGLSRCGIDAITAHSVDEAAQMIRGVLEGRPGPCRQIVLLNAAAGLTVAGAAPDLPRGLERARRAIDSGRAAETLARLVEASRP